MTKKSLLILVGIVLFLVAYTQLSKSTCEARISYANIDLNKDIDLEEVFAPPTANELQKVRTSWQAFDAQSDVVTLVHSYRVAPEREIHIFAHEAEGRNHYGAVILPKTYDAAKEYPIFLWANGLNQEDPSVRLNHPIIRRLTTALENYFIVIPSYRGQALVNSQRQFCSDGFFGDAFDGATDDALRLLALTKDRFAGAGQKGISVCGLSRGRNYCVAGGGS